MISNKSLSVLIIAAVVLSLGGTLISLNQLEKLGEKAPQVKTFTGLATGQLNLTITSTANCVVDTNVTFGASSQPSGSYSLTTERDNSLTTGFFNCTESAPASNCTGLQINNTGNVDLNVTINSNSNASSLLVSQTNLDITDFRYFVANGSSIGNLSNGCRNATNLTAQIEQLQLNVIQATDQLICRNFTYSDGTDVMHLEFNVTVEPDITPGTKTAILTITCQQV